MANISSGTVFYSCIYAQYAFLGTVGKLGNSPGCLWRYAQGPETDITQDDLGINFILGLVYAIRLEGATPKLSPASLPRHQ
jgi:hypothetical protein